MPEHHRESALIVNIDAALDCEQSAASGQMMDRFVRVPNAHIGRALDHGKPSAAAIKLICIRNFYYTDTILFASMSM